MGVIMKKRFINLISVLLCLAVLFSFAGCNSAKTAETKYLEITDAPTTTLDNVWYNPGGIFRCGVFDSLLNVDAKMDKMSECLAEKYTYSDDKTSFTFTIRDDVLWHDGEIFDVKDVLFSVKAVLRTEEVNGVISAAFQYIKGAVDYSEGKTEELSGVITDGRNITFVLEKGATGFIQAIAQFAILPEHILGDTEPNQISLEEDFWLNPVGTGCYKVVESKKDEYYILKRNDKYFGEKAGIENIRINLDKTNPVDDMASGELDFYVTNDPAEISRLKGIERCNEHRLNILFPAYLIFNFSENGNMSKELKDVRVRRALLLAIDRESITTSVFPGSTVSNTLIPEWDSWYYSDGEDFKFNQEAARKLLEEANFDFSKTLRLRYSKKGQSTVDLMNAIAVYWREIGIKVDLADFEGSGSEHMFEIRDFDVCYKRLSAFDHASIYEEVDGGGIMQQKLLNMPVYDELLNELSNTTSDGHRKELILKLQQLDQEYLLRIPLFFLANTAYVNYKCFKMPDVYGNLWYRYDLQFSDWSLKR